MAVFKICDYEDAEGMRCSSIALSAKKRLCSSHYIENLESQNKKLKEALRYYRDSLIVTREDNEDAIKLPTMSGGLYVIGKLARQVLKEIDNE